MGSNFSTTTLITPQEFRMGVQQSYHQRQYKKQIQAQKDHKEHLKNVEYYTNKCRAEFDKYIRAIQDKGDITVRAFRFSGYDSRTPCMRITNEGFSSKYADKSLTLPVLNNLQSEFRKSGWKAHVNKCLIVEEPDTIA